MSIEIIDNGEYKALFCNTTMWAFGGVFYEHEDAQNFMNWLGVDARTLTNEAFSEKQLEWRGIKHEIKVGAKSLSTEFLDQLEVEMDDVDSEQYPEFEDAFIKKAFFKGVELDEDDINEISDKATWFVHNKATEAFQ